MNDEAVAIMKSLVERGASRVTLVRAAAAAARAVIPLAGKWRSEAVDAINTVERWVRNPDAANRRLAENQVFSIGHHKRKMATRKEMSEIFAILAAKNAVLACFHVSDLLHPAVFAVECAEKAAAVHGINIAVLVTAEML